MIRTTLVLALALLFLNGCATSLTDDPRRLVIVTVADKDTGGMPPRGYHQPGYRISDGAASALAGLERDYRLTPVDGWPIDLLNVYCAVMAIDPTRGVDETLARISADPRVQLAQPMQVFDVHGGYDDPYFDQQYGAGSARVLQMHQTATGRGVRIAVIDTGADRSHPDLKGRIGTVRNFVGDDSRFDSDIHGTAVAGIIAANADNGIGIVGIAPDADLLLLKACWQTALDDISAQCNTFTLAKALTFAIDQHADIINMSLGGPNDPLLGLLIDLALSRGIVVVAAQDAPNEFPADRAGVIAVRTAQPDEPQPAPDVTHPVVVDAAARNLLSTSPGGRYDYFSGSSMGAARVAGLSALQRQEHAPLSTPQLIRDLDQRLAALGGHGSEPDTRLVTHALDVQGGVLPPSGRQPAVSVSRIDGT